MTDVVADDVAKAENEKCGCGRNSEVIRNGEKVCVVCATLIDEPDYPFDV